MRQNARERTLLRLIQQQAKTISDLNDRLMFMAEKPWTLPPAALTEFQPPDEEQAFSALHGLPPGYEEE